MKGSPALCGAAAEKASAHASINGLISATPQPASAARRRSMIRFALTRGAVRAPSPSLPRSLRLVCSASPPRRLRRGNVRRGSFIASPKKPAWPRTRRPGSACTTARSPPRKPPRESTEIPARKSAPVAKDRRARARPERRRQQGTLRRRRLRSPPRLWSRRRRSRICPRLRPMARCAEKFREPGFTSLENALVCAPMTEETCPCRVAAQEKLAFAQCAAPISRTKRSRRRPKP